MAVGRYRWCCKAQGNMNYKLNNEQWNNRGHPTMTNTINDVNQSAKESRENDRPFTTINRMNQQSGKATGFSIE